MSDNNTNASELESIVDSPSTSSNENHSLAEPKEVILEEAPTSQNSAQVNSKSNYSSQKNIDWQKLAHKLREHNRKLLKRVFTLEQEVAEAQTRCEEQNNQFINNNLLLEEQANKLNGHQAEVANLLQEAEKAQKSLEKQRNSTQNLAQELERSQQEIAKMERECTKLQDSNTEKDYKLTALDKQVQELQNRLERQQQNNLKYRATLEKYISTGEFPKETVPSSSFPKIGNSEPIKSWSDSHDPEEMTVMPRKLMEVADYSETSPATANKEVAAKNSSNWPAPEITIAKKENQPKSIAAVKLPRFPRKSTS